MQAEVCNVQGAPMLELHASIAGLLATYDDGGSQLADAADTHLGLHLGLLNADVELSPGALYLQVCLLTVALRAIARFTSLKTRCIRAANTVRNLLLVSQHQPGILYDGCSMRPQMLSPSMSCRPDL